MDAKPASIRNLRIERIEMLDPELIASKKENFTVYPVRVHVASMEPWTVKRRYNQFYQMHSKLASKFTGLPKLPPKTLLRSMDSTFIAQRREKLQEYLNQLLQREDIACSSVLNKFCNPAEYITLLDLTKVSMEGYLLKQSHSLANRQWHKRWFVLQGRWLYYWRSRESLQSGEPPSASLDLHCTTVVASPATCSFELRLPDVANADSYTTYVFKAASPQELSSWVDALRAASAARPQSTAVRPAGPAAPPVSSANMSTVDTATTAKLQTYVEQAGKPVGNVKRLLRRLEAGTDAVSTSYVYKRDSDSNLLIEVPNNGPVTASVRMARTDEAAADAVATRPASTNMGSGVSTSSTVIQPRIRGGTPDKLIEKLLDDGLTDANYIWAFLLTYRSFTTPQHLLETLVELFRQPPPKTVVSVDQLEESKERKWKKSDVSAVGTASVEAAKLRVLTVLTKWLEVHFFDFIEDAQLNNQLLRFIDCELEGRGYDTFAAKLRAQIKKKVVPTKEAVQDLSKAPPPILPSVAMTNFSLMDLSPVEVARQLALLESRYFRQIMPKECLNQAWNKDGKERKAPNIVAIINRFNRMSAWVTAMVLTAGAAGDLSSPVAQAGVAASTPRTRAPVLARLIEIGVRCRELNNFSAVMFIVSGLENSSIFRLRKTWEVVPAASLAAFEGLKELMSSTHNYKNYREAMHRVDPPLVPYLGTYLTDLVFIDDGNPDTIGPHGLVNFSKRARLAEVIKEIQMYQQLPYMFRPVEAIAAFLSPSDDTKPTDQQLYATSVQLEERASAN